MMAERGVKFVRGMKIGEPCALSCDSKKEEAEASSLAMSPSTWDSSPQTGHHTALTYPMPAADASTPGAERTVPLRTVFDLLDRNGRGEIDVRDFATVVQALTAGGEIPLSCLVHLFPTCALQPRTPEDERRLLAMLVAPCCDGDKSVEVKLNYDQFVHKYDALGPLFAKIGAPFPESPPGRFPRMASTTSEDQEKAAVRNVPTRTLSEVSSISDVSTHPEDSTPLAENTGGFSRRTAAITLSNEFSPGRLNDDEQVMTMVSRKRSIPSATPRMSYDHATMETSAPTRAPNPTGSESSLAFPIHPETQKAHATPDSSAKVKRRAVAVKAIVLTPDEPPPPPPAPASRGDSTGGRTNGSTTTDQDADKRSSSRRRHLRRTQSVHADWEIDAKELKMGRSLGGGKFGLVREATWRGAPVAVKRLKASVNDEGSVDRFHREAFLLANMRHPNILMFLGAVLDPVEKSIQLVTELLDMSLHDLLYGESYLSNHLTRGHWFQICRQICLGLNYLHLGDPHIVHRDIKPKNVLIRLPLFVKIADFGISVANDSEDGGSIVGLCGTLPYMSPELLRNEPYDNKVDVYSFAMVAYECMVRNRPLAAEPPMRIILSVGIHGHRPKLPNSTPPDIANIITRAWAQQADQRPSVEHLLFLLDQAEPNAPADTLLLHNATPVKASESWGDEPALDTPSNA